MDYFIITKIEYSDGTIYTPIGHVLSLEDAQVIDAIHYSDFKNWLINNNTDLESGALTTNDYLSVNPPVYMHLSTTDCCLEFADHLITNQNNPEA